VLSIFNVRLPLSRRLIDGAAGAIGAAGAAGAVTTLYVVLLAKARRLWRWCSIQKRYRYSPSPRFTYSNFADLVGACSFPQATNMAAARTVAHRLFQYDVQYIHYTVDSCPRSTVRRNAGWTG